MRKNLLSTVAMVGVATSIAWSAPARAQTAADSLTTKTPIKHLVVIFNENRSFDHYFGTYPNAMNTPGEPVFTASSTTQTDINNYVLNPTLLTNNPNLNPANGTAASNPLRIDRTQANTASQNHSYMPEQEAYDGGKNDLFPKDTGAATNGGVGAFGTKAQVMGYFDGNTVTAFWNYAQNYAMSDNAFTDTFGPSTPGALEMFSGQTNGVVPGAGSSNQIMDGQGGLTLIGDIDPTFDVCSSTTSNASMSAKNIGDLLNAANIPWGSFVGGFNLTTTNANGSTGCSRSSVSPIVGTVTDYVQHHIWFQYYKSTSNPLHLRPSSTAAIGFTNIPGTTRKDPANHGYDLNDFTTAVSAGNFPAVSFIKMAAFQDAHPGNSDPLDEQTGVVTLINFLQQQPDWANTAVIIAYDDSDGWYDHVTAPTTSGSFSASDALNGTGNCGIPGVTPEPNGLKGLPVAGRCGPGTRTPFLVISPFAKTNYVDHTGISQASIPQFIEDNWLGSQRLGGGSFDATTGSIMNMFDFTKTQGTTLLLDPNMGTVTATGSVALP
jgi:phospholipase C